MAYTPEPMADVVRIGVSLEPELLERFDRLLGDRGITNRSEALRDLVRDHLVEADLSDEAEALGTLTMVFDHRKRALSAGLTSMQHDHGHVVSSMHVHVDEDHCLEVVAMRGRLGELRHLADRMLASKGVLHGQLVVTSMAALTGRAPQASATPAAGPSEGHHGRTARGAKKPLPTGQGPAQE